MSYLYHNKQIIKMRISINWGVLKMSKMKKIKKFIKSVTKNNVPVKSKPIIISNADIPKKSKYKKPIETGFICDDFEILL